MPIDPSILFRGQQAPTPSASPFQLLGQVAELENARSLIEARRLAGEEARMKRTRQAQIDEAWAAAFRRDPVTGEVTYDETVLAQRAPGSELPKMLRERQEDAEKGMAYKKSKLETALKAREFLGSLSRSVAAAQYDPTVFGVAMREALETGAINQETFDKYKDLPPGQIKAVVDGAIAETATPGEGEFSLSPGQQRFRRGGGEPIASVPATTPKPEMPSLQAKEVLIDGRPALANFNPQTGTYTVGGQDVTARVQPIPAQGPDPTLKAIRDLQLQQMQQSGATPQQIATFNQIAGAYERSPLIRAADRTIVLDDAVKAVRANPQDPAAQLQLAYAYIQGLDTYQSAVREGELQNLGILGTRLEQLGVQANRLITTGAFLPPTVAAQIAQNAEQLSKTISSGARRKQQEFGARAKASGVDAQWQQFISGFPAPGGPAEPAAGGTGTGATAAAPTSTTKARVGERRIIKGQLAEWDGQGWKAVQESKAVR